jgi:peptide/nickel transport system substrate-binding protein
MDGIEFRPMPDASARLAAFRSEQVGYSYSIVDKKRDLEQLIATNPDIVVTTRTPDNSAGAMPLLNHQNPKWQDVRVRRAFSMALDRQALSTLTYEGLGRTLSILPWAFALDEVPTIENGGLGNWVRYAPDEAKQLLMAAGQENMTVESPYYEYASSYTQTAEIYVDQLRQVGIDYQPKKLDYTEYNSQLIRGTFPDALHWGYLPLGFEADTYFLNGIHSASPGNRDHMSDPDIDKWATEQQVELDADARRDLHKKIWDKYHDQLYRPLATNGQGFQTLQPWVRNMRLGGPLGIASTFYDWGEITLKGWLNK